MSYLYQGMEFHSTKDLSSYCGVKETTIRARLHRGMSIEEACSLTDHRCRYIEDKPVISIIREQGQDPDLVNNRLKYGYSLQEALNTPKKTTRQGRPIIVWGVLYQSISAALRADIKAFGTADDISGLKKAEAVADQNTE